MPRTRYLKPEFFFDEELCQHPYEYRLGYEGLWVNADKAGRLEDRPQRLKAKIFPYDPVDMEVLLTALARTGFIIRYLAEGKAYIAIKPKAWEDHQRPRPDEQDSKIPPPDNHSVIYASLGDREELAVSLRETETVQSRNSTVTAPVQRMGMGILSGNGNGNGGSAESLTRSTPPDDSEVLLTFPTVGKDGQQWHLRTRQLEEWRDLYSTLDVLAEAQQALAWIRANQSRRKTPRGMPGFLVNWLNRSVRQGGAKAATERPASDYEVRQFDNWRRAVGGCAHDEPCSDRAECMGKFLERVRGRAS